MSANRLKLAGDIKSFCQTEWWRDILKPYLEEERKIQIENMASQTDAMQLMRYAGAAQALGNLLRMGEASESVIQEEMKKSIDNSGNLT